MILSSLYQVCKFWSIKNTLQIIKPVEGYGAGANVRLSGDDDSNWQLSGPNSSALTATSRSLLFYDALK